MNETAGMKKWGWEALGKKGDVLLTTKDTKEPHFSYP
jgi:hypothetical protein